jgi:hypothetical protein
VSADEQSVTLPQNLEAEAALLGALMIDNRLIEDVMSKLRPEHFAESLCPAIHDPRYIRWGGRPVILVYRVSDLPNPSDFAQRLRYSILTSCGADPYLLCVWSFDELDPLAIGFDGAVQFPPLQIATPNLASSFGLDSAAVYAYPEAMRHGCLQLAKPHSFPLYPGVCPSWDNTPRRQDCSVSWLGATPDHFRRWVSLSRRLSQGKPLFVNAWNEWGEGCHLEPDQVWGYEWLEALRDGFMAHDQEFQQTHRLLVFGHDAYNAGSQRSLLALLTELRLLIPTLGLHLILLAGGELLDSFRALCPVTILSSIDGASRDSLFSLDIDPAL